MSKPLKKSAKAIIITAVVILVAAAVVLSVMFGLLNNFKFMTYSDAKIQKAIEDYPSHELQFVAHRGLSKEAYQNTAAAFKAAASYDGVWAVETDVWVTSDGDFVCMHDRNALKNVPDVSKITLEEALKTPLKGDETQFAPSLREYLNICMEGGKVALVELKDKHMSEEAMDCLLERIAEVGADVRIISFHFNLLSYIRSKDADMGLWYLYNLTPALDVPGTTRAEKLNTIISMRMDVGINSIFLMKSDVEKIHAAGLKVDVWTVNSARDAILYASEFDADYLTSDVRISDDIDEMV